jgi:hypothetical protein
MSNKSFAEINDGWGLPHPAPIIKPETVAKSNLDTVLLQWQAAKDTLSTAKEEEMRLRKLAVELGFGERPDEGTNTKAFGQGYDLKAVIKYTYNLCLPTNASEDATLVDEVNKVVDNMTAISNEGSFIATRLFKWSVDLTVSEYKKIVEEAKHNPLYKKLLDEVNRVVLIKDAAPTLEIKAPKAKK